MVAMAAKEITTTFYCQRDDGRDAHGHTNCALAMSMANDVFEKISTRLWNGRAYQYPHAVGR